MIMRKLVLTTVFVFAFGLTVSSIMASAQEDYNIPAWIKNNAAWWSEGQIDDASFVSGIKYMIENDIMEIETTDTSTYHKYPDNGDFYITYKPNPNSLYEEGYTAMAYLKSWELLEYEVQFLNENFRLPYDVEIIAQECNEINAFYDYITKKVIICYEFIDDVQEKYTWFHYNEFDGTDENWNNEDFNNYSYDVVDFVFWHEMGHAFIDIYELPITGLEENVADQFAALMLLYYYDETTGDYSLGQSMVDNVGTWFYNSDYYQTNYDQNYFPAYWGLHALDMQRFYNVSCYAYGSNPYSDAVVYLVEDGWLPEERAYNCEWEYAQIEYAFANLLEPFDNGFFD